MSDLLVGWEQFSFVNPIAILEVCKQMKLKSPKFSGIWMLLNVVRESG